MAVWLITGASRGLGRVWARAALERGDRVAATARDVVALDDLVTKFGDQVLPLRLDVEDRTRAFACVAEAARHFGRLDIVVNCAGYAHFGFVEELSEADIRRQMEVNFFGALWVTQAALPVMRRQRAGHIVQVSSVGGVTARQMLGGYNASKWALEGMSQALSMEVAPFGIRITILEPGAFATDATGDSAGHSEPVDAYAARRDEITSAFRTQLSGVAAPPEATVPALFAVVDSDDPPLRMFLGARGLPLVRADYASRIATWEAWQAVSESAST